MAESPFLNDMVVVFGMAVAVAWLFRMLGAPSILGFLLTGLAIGPSGWQFVSEESVNEFAEVGLVLLLFTVGLELSPAPLVRSGWRLLAATALQVGSTVAVTALAMWGVGDVSWKVSLVIGFAVAFSSTAITLKQLSDRGETDSTAGRISTGILLLQDVLVIVVLLALSMTSSFASAQTVPASIVRMVLNLAGLAGLTVAARWALPKVLDQVSLRGGRELTTLFAVLLACGGAWAASRAGWSPALGACIAGLLLAGVDQRHQLVAEITPFRDVFNAMFFIALGMMVDIGAMFHFALPLCAAVMATLAIKSFLTGGAVCAAGWPVRIGLQAGIGLCTVSEFSYVLVREAAKVGILPESTLDFMVAYAVGTMAAGALVIPAAQPFAAALSDRLNGRRQTAFPVQEDNGPSRFENHVIVVGYGFTGANLARMLKATRVPFCVIEMNRGLVDAARRAGTPVVVGDATRTAILAHAGLENACAAVVAINDDAATERIVAQMTAQRPDLYLLARTNYVSGIDALYKVGAKLVIPQDFETSIEIAAHVLKQFGIPDNIVDAQIASVRAGGYGMLRGKPSDRAAHAELIKILERTATQTFYLDEESFACGLTLAELNLRALTGCMIIAVVRSGRPTANPGPDFQLAANDVLVLVGAHRQMEAAKALLQKNRDAASARPGS
ncbi:MAG TPA: cation:proton antiporter [Candidatus Hydrogenedentes bacterium]|nr:cation:proton antiporter [Candidatus Hydrogenedentota bacterium]